VKYSRKYTEDWDFLGVNTRIGTNCYHDYPAKMIPQIAGKLIDRYGKKSGLLFDPYCGSGTSLTEGRIRGMNCIGTDLNPMARMIAEAKSRLFNIIEIEKHFEIFIVSVKEAFTSLKDLKSLVKPSTITGKELLTWWPEKAIQEMLTLLELINGIDSEEIQHFYKVAFSECLRIISFQRNSEFKKYRMEEKKREGFYVPLFTEFEKRVIRNISGFKAYKDKFDNNTEIKVYDFNTVKSIPSSVLKSESVDLVVTSPPYGDSGTTVAYGQYSWFANTLFGFANKVIDGHLMGNSKSTISKFGLSSMDGAITEIVKINPKRAGEVMNFFVDYLKSITNVSKTISKGGTICYVVGNRTVAGIQLPTDQFTAWAFEQLGFKFGNIEVRKIPNKRMPSVNSPSNVSGVKSPTMTNEFIVIMTKLAPIYEPKK